MTSGIRAAFCVAAVCLAGCGAPSVGTIAGKVVFSDGSDATGLAVTLLGGVGKQDVTISGGAYSFEKLPDGVYLLSVEAADTKEKKLSFGATVKGTEKVDAPDLTFNPVATLTGKVTNAAMMPAVGATVFLSGSDHVALTDGAGSYKFSDIPTGDYSVVAKADGAIGQSATATVKLKRGKNDGPALQLADDLAVTGKLAGTVYYFNGDKPAGIKMSVADVTANTDDSGNFSLTLPPGSYSLIAEAAGFPKQSLGWFTVRAGETTVVPPTPISLYKKLPIYEQGYSPTWLAVSEGDVAILKMQNSGDYGTAVYTIDTKNVDRKLLFVGNPTSYHLSKLGKWFAFQVTNLGVAVISTETGKTYTFAGTIITGPLISNDESTMMFWSQGQNLLYRVDLATGTATTFPAFAGSFFQNNERFLARTTNSNPFDVQLITPTTSTLAFPQMQTEVPYFGTATQIGSTVTYPLAYAYTCAANCEVRVLGLNQNASSVVNVNTIPLAPAVIPGTVREWIGFSWGGITPGRILVKVETGTATTLPAATFQLYFNETATRVVSYAVNSGNSNTDVREDTVPPSATSPVHLSVPTVQNQAWISPTRFIAFATLPTVKLLDLKAGVPSSITDFIVDVAAQSPYFLPPSVSYLKCTQANCPMGNMTPVKRTAITYDSAEFGVDTIGANSSFNFTGVGSRTGVLNSTLGKYAVLFDGASSFVLDGIKAESRKSPGVAPQTSNTLFVPTDRFRASPFGPASSTQSVVLQFFETGKTLMITEPLRYSVTTASLPKGGTITAAYSYDQMNNTYLNLALLP